MESLHYLLMKAHTMLNQKILSQAATIGLSSGQPKILEYLTEHEGSDQKTIAAYCKIEQATVGSILTRMENAGLIERRQTPGNRRSLYVYMTEKGRDAARKMEPIFTDSDCWAVENLTEEETLQLKSLLDKICIGMDTNQME